MSKASASIAGCCWSAFLSTAACARRLIRGRTPVDWHLHRAEERYLGFIFDRGAEVAAPQPGDVMVVRYGRTYSHGGIISIAAPLTIVHAYFPARSVLEEEIGRNSVLSDSARKPRFFSYWTRTP